MISLSHFLWAGSDLLIPVIETSGLELDTERCLLNHTHARTFGIGVFFEFLLQSIQWERTQLLHTDERRVLVGCRDLPLFQQSIVMLAGTQHHPLDTAENK